ncbi:hypothetical protein Hanom_Chr17g01556641 [Helianthus anomalus]
MAELGHIFFSPEEVAYVFVVLFEGGLVWFVIFVHEQEDGEAKPVVLDGKKQYLILYLEKMGQAKVNNGCWLLSKKLKNGEVVGT